MNGKRIFNSLVFGIMLLAVFGVDFTYDSLAYASQPLKLSAQIPQVEVMAVVVDPDSGLTTNEAGSLQPTFEVYLDADPGSPVTVTLESLDLTEGTVSPSSMDFDSDNYTIHQTATVTGVDDNIIDGDQPYTINVSLSTDDTPVSVTNLDDDASLTLTKTVITDDGGTAVAADFQAYIDGNPVDWDVAQIITAGSHTASEDNLPGYSPSAWGGDCAADGSITLAVGEVKTCTITNDDIPPTLTLEKTVVTDDGGTAVTGDFQAYIDETPVDWGAPQILTAGSYTASEDTLPGYVPSVWGGDCAADGSIILAIGDDMICTITNDDIAPTLTLEKTVINDNGGGADEADFQAYIDEQAVPWDVAQIITAGSHTASEDTLPGYAPSDWGGDCATDGSITLAVGEVKTCTITNDDIAPTLTLFKNVINDNGGTAVETDFQAQIDGSPVTWNVAQPLTVGEHTASEITLPYYTASTWSGACAADGTIILNEGDNLNCTITNDDLAVEFASGTSSVDESTPTLLVTVQLSDLSGFEVTVPYIISGTALEGSDYTITPSPLVIPAGQISADITITVIDDYTPEADKTIILTMDTPINAFPGTTTVHTATILDDDIVGITVDPTAGLLTSEDGLSDTFTVVLDTQPTADVTIGLSSSDTTEGTINKPSLIFTPANWDTAQEVTITGVDDYLADGDVIYNITANPAVSSDPNYSGVDPADVEVTNSDNDTAGITITPTSDWTTEAGISRDIKILIKTKPKPLTQVTLNFSSTDTTEGTVTPTQIIVNPGEWTPGTPYTITITGVDDTLIDGNISYKVNMITTSDDSDYGGKAFAIQMVNYDAPMIEWVSPVGDDETYEIDDLVPILLEVRSVGNEPISKVRFYRWDVDLSKHITIGDDLDPPYQVFLDPADLKINDDNQIWAYAFGTTTTPDNNLTFSEHKRILIYRREGTIYRIYLPLIFKQTQ